MELLRLALADLRYQRSRSLLAMSGVAIAVAVLLSLWGLNTGYEAALDESIDSLGYHVLVTAKGCPYETATLFLRGGNIPMYIDETIHRQVAADPAVEGITPLFLQAVAEPESGRHRVYMGIDETFFPMRPSLQFQRGRAFSGPLVAEAIVGYSVAEYLGIELGDTIGVPGKSTELEVVGVLDRSGTQDDGTVFLPLGIAQQVFDKKHKLTGLGVRLEDVRALPEFVERVYEIPSVQPIMMMQVRRTVLDLLDSAQTFVTAVGVVAVLVAAMAVMNTMLMSVMERMAELGVMRALGASRTDLFVLIATEAIVACLIGGGIGIALAMVGESLAGTVMRQFLPYAPSGPIVDVSWGHALKALAASAAMGVLAALYPAFRAASLQPVRAIRDLA